MPLRALSTGERPNEIDSCRFAFFMDSRTFFLEHDTLLIEYRALLFLIFLILHRGKANEIERRRFYERMVSLGRTLMQIRKS